MKHFGFSAVRPFGQHMVIIVRCRKQLFAYDKLECVRVRMKQQREKLKLLTIIQCLMQMSIINMMRITSNLTRLLHFQTRASFFVRINEEKR